MTDDMRPDVQRYLRDLRGLGVSDVIFEGLTREEALALARGLGAAESAPRAESESRPETAVADNVQSPAVLSPPSSLVTVFTNFNVVCVLVKVQVTVSPGWRSIALTGLPSSQVAEVRSQPAGTVSAAL